MTGAGAGTLAYRLEDNGFLSTPTTGGWKQPGVNESADPEFDNNPTPIHQGDAASPVGSKPQNFIGSMTVTFDLTDDNWHELVWGTSATTIRGRSGQAPTAQWWVGADVAGTTESRPIAGAACTDATLIYNEGGNWQVELQISYADEPDSISEPSSIEQPGEDKVFAHHGTTFNVSELGEQSLQSMQLSLPTLARRRDWQDFKARDYVVAKSEPEASITALFEDNTTQQLGYGGTAPSRPVDGVTDAALSLANGVGDTIDYTLKGLDPQTYGWSGLFEAGENHVQNEVFDVDDVAIA